MNKETLTIFHRNGKKVTITDIPSVNNEIERFKIKWNLEKLIDEINKTREPQSTYSLKEVLEDSKE
ncbi:DUF2535 family protein [Halalkalibacterium ligniniphilum]|uniref:DUF2535 family protein n=1 Tax=Halalkalibacterium ligniniphilum TaxID=1134413 RepID=UPI000345CBE6|nr:DUF2535 family protein [Halalkalibacterium ligniniphilum]